MERMAFRMGVELSVPETSRPRNFPSPKLPVVDGDQVAVGIIGIRVERVIGYIADDIVGKPGRVNGKRGTA
jgi:hypothetical protein